MDLRLTESADGKSVNLRVGQQFTIVLQENPTTGFRWQFVENGKPVVQLDRDFFKASSRQLGAGGLHEWLFHAASSGQVTITMKLARAWNQNASARSFSVRLRVT